MGASLRNSVLCYGLFHSSKGKFTNDYCFCSTIKFRPCLKFIVLIYWMGIVTVKKTIHTAHLFHIPPSCAISQKQNYNIFLGKGSANHFETSPTYLYSYRHQQKPRTNITPTQHFVACFYAPRSSYEIS